MVGDSRKPSVFMAKMRQRRPAVLERTASLRRQVPDRRGHQRRVAPNTHVPSTLRKRVCMVGPLRIPRVVRRPRAMR